MMTRFKDTPIHRTYCAIRREAVSRDRAALCYGGLTWDNKEVSTEIGKAWSALLEARMRHKNGTAVDHTKTTIWAV